jgi:chromosome segregation ATPase
MKEMDTRKTNKPVGQDLLDDLSMKPSRDDLVMRQKVTGTKPRPIAAAAPPATPAGSRLAWLLVVLVMASAGAAGWYMWQEMLKLQRQLVASTQMLGDAQNRLTELQSGLASQHSNLSASEKKLFQDIEQINGEVRKLSDLVNKRNRADIVDQQQRLTGLEEQLAGQRSQVTQLQQSLQKVADDAKEQRTASLGHLTELRTAQATVVTDIKGLHQQWGSLKQSVEQFEKQFGQQLGQLQQRTTGLQTGVDQLKQQATQHQEKLTVQAGEIRALRQVDQNGHETRLQNAEAEIRSIDAFRQQVSRKLSQLEGELRQLSQPQAISR